jgi:HSP20 family protein
MYGEFSRSFTLPSGTDPDQIKAQYENGVLTILVPKVETKQKRAVEIQEGRRDEMGSEKKQVKQQAKQSEENPRH